MSDKAPDPYRVLGVARDAQADTVKKKYRKLARELHPDRGGDPEKLKSVNAAYAIVGDEAKRKLYDEFGHTAFRPGFDASTARRFKNMGGGGFGGGGFGGGGFGGGGFDLDELMRMFTGSGSARPRSGFGGGPGAGFGRGPRRGEDRHANLSVTLGEAFSGSERNLKLGSKKPITVRIPKGVRAGQRLRVSGKGSPGVDGGPPGDLFLEIQLEEHELVRVDRDDLEMDLPLTFIESLQGGSITVSTPTGSVNVKIPPRAEAGTRLRLKGRGLPRGGKGTRTGDLYLVLRPTPPNKKPSGDSLEDLEKAYTRDVRADLRFDD